MQEKAKTEYVSGMQAKLKPLADFLGNQEWFVGGVLTIADFVVYDTLTFHDALAPQEVAKFPNLKTFMARFEAVPRIKKFLDSDKNYKNFTPPFAAWGGNVA